MVTDMATCRVPCSHGTLQAVKPSQYSGHLTARPDPNLFLGGLCVEFQPHATPRAVSLVLLGCNAPIIYPRAAPPRPLFERECLHVRVSVWLVIGTHDRPVLHVVKPRLQFICVPGLRCVGLHIPCQSRRRWLPGPLLPRPSLPRQSLPWQLLPAMRLRGQWLRRRLRPRRWLPWQSLPRQGWGANFADWPAPPDEPSRAQRGG